MSGTGCHRKFTKRRYATWLRRKIDASFNREIDAESLKRCVGPEDVKPVSQRPQPNWDADDLGHLGLPDSEQNKLRDLGMSCSKLARLDALNQLGTLPGIDHDAVSAAIERWVGQEGTSG